MLTNRIMPASVHIPGALLAALDRRARALRISRHQLVVRALERELRDCLEWSPGFFARLAERDPGLADAVAELGHEVRSARQSKAAPWEESFFRSLDEIRREPWGSRDPFGD